MLNTPVLFIIFNQPDITKKVFEAIKSVKPKILYISGDGPRNEIPGEIIQCEKTRSIINEIDWDCDLHTRFLDKNMGCNDAIWGALNWFFDKITEGIVLESDCLPHPDFWYYTSELLERYRNKTEIKFIGGNNYQNSINRGDGSYFFSKMAYNWGWATWKRAWQEFDYDICNKYSKNSFHKIINSQFVDNDERKYWKKIFKFVREDRPYMWDFRILFSIWAASGITIAPNVNLVTNIGFHPDALTTKDISSPYNNLPLESILPIRHPSKIKIDIEADLYYYRNYLHNSIKYDTFRKKIEEMLPWKFRKATSKKIKSILKIIRG